MSEVLYWHDLSSSDIWDIAHQEKQAREAASADLARIAFIDNPLASAAFWDRATQILVDYENAAQLWLQEQAASRGLFPAPAEIPMVKDDPAKWINELLAGLPGIEPSQLAAEAMLAHGYLSELRMGIKKNPSQKTINKLVDAYARIKRGTSTFSKH